MNIQGWFPLGMTGLISLMSKGLTVYYYIDLDLLVFIFFWLSITFWTNTGLIPFLSLLFFIFWNKASLVAQLVKNLPAKQKTWVWSLGQEDPLEKEMATHSSTLIWRIPWTEEPGRVQSMGYKESDMTVQLTFTFNWRREWQPTPVFLPGKSHRQRGLAGYSLGGQKELDTTEWLSMHTRTEKYINHKGIDQLCFTS